MIVFGQVDNREESIIDRLVEVESISRDPESGSSWAQKLVNRAIGHFVEITHKRLLHLFDVRRGSECPRTLIHHWLWRARILVDIVGKCTIPGTVHSSNKTKKLVWLRNRMKSLGNYEISAGIFLNHIWHYGITCTLEVRVNKILSDNDYRDFFIQHKRLTNASSFICYRYVRSTLNRNVVWITRMVCVSI